MMLMKKICADMRNGKEFMMEEVKMVYYNPAGGETLVFVTGSTKEKLNKNIEQEIKSRGWNRAYVEIVAEKDAGNGKWYWR